MFRRPLIAAALALAALSPAAAAGVKQVTLHTSDGQTLPIGTVAFTPRDGKIGFKVDRGRALPGLLPLDARVQVP